MRNPSNGDYFVADALRAYARSMIRAPDAFSKEEAKSLDRALRSCPAIGDIDAVWVMWTYVGEGRGWSTVNEFIPTKSSYRYPDHKDKK